jgi:hypothetical protein
MVRRKLRKEFFMKKWVQVSLAVAVVLFAVSAKKVADNREVSMTKCTKEEPAPAQTDEGCNSDSSSEDCDCQSAASQQVSAPKKRVSAAQRAIQAETDQH